VRAGTVETPLAPSGGESRVGADGALATTSSVEEVLWVITPETPSMVIG
jgi:hypothetical protein